jgi:ABC-type transport system involved in multi-copper enzyme maturation permease subunit
VTEIFIKELRGTLRERRGYLIPMLYMLLLGAVVSMGYSTLEAARSDFSYEPLPAEAGRTIAITVAILQGIAVMLVAPLVGSSLISGERERGTWVRLLASPANRGGILLGKAGVGLCFLLLLLACSLPEALLAYAYGGMDAPALLGLYFSHAVVATTMICLGLAISTLFQRSWVAALVALGSSLVLVVLTLTTYVWISAAQHHQGHSSSVELLLALDPAQTWVLFFAPPSRLALVAWWCHFGMMALLGAASLAFGWVQLRKAGD